MYIRPNILDLTPLRKYFDAISSHPTSFHWIFRAGVMKQGYITSASLEMLRGILQLEISADPGGRVIDIVVSVGPSVSSYGYRELPSVSEFRAINVPLLNKYDPSPRGNSCR